MKLPIIFRKKHETEIKNRELQISSLEWEISGLKEELILANRVTNEILPRLVKLREPILDRDFDSYRICTDLSRPMVENCFIHGNDDRMIKYFAKVLSKQIEQKLIQFNFIRQ